MENKYEGLDREALIEILKRRDAQSRYGLVWERQDIDPDRALNRDFVGLTLNDEHCCGPAPWSNLIVEGDNYDSLRVLSTHYAGQVKLIYIDPPYNTGSKDFVYNDHFFDPTDRFRHSTWLEFMYQRLTLARDLLSDDGSIWVSIDDNELFALGMLMNQVFGESCHVATCIWQKRYSRENREAIGDVHEYLLVYSPNPDQFKRRRGLTPISEDQAKVYRNPNNDPRGRWRPVPITAQAGHATPDQFYTIVAPSGKKFRPSAGRCWGMSEATFERLRSEGRIYFGKDGNSQPNLIRYLSEVGGVAPWTWWPHEEVGHTDEAAKELLAMFGSEVTFDTPKPVRLLRRVLAIGAPEKDALVLDFFAGSGTFGQAVLEMNKEDGGRRRFILAASAERTAGEPDKNLCRDVCASRLRKAIEGYETPKGVAVDGLGGSVGYLKAQTVPMHRLEDGLDDGMVWYHALMMAGHPIRPLQGALNLSEHNQSRVIYCTDVKVSTLAQLKKILTDEFLPTAVFSWAPARIQDLAASLDVAVTVVSVPEDLRRIFRQGSARTSSRTEAEA